MIFWNFSDPFTTLACLIWNFCEYLNISLGKISPYVLSQALGKKGKKLNKTK